MNKDVCCPWRARERGKGWEGTGKVIKKRGGKERKKEKEESNKKKKKETNVGRKKEGEEREKKILALNIQNATN